MKEIIENIQQANLTKKLTALRDLEIVCQKLDINLYGLKQFLSHLPTGLMQGRIYGPEDLATTRAQLKTINEKITLILNNLES